MWLDCIHFSSPFSLAMGPMRRPGQATLVKSLEQQGWGSQQIALSYLPDALHTLFYYMPTATPGAFTYLFTFKEGDLVGWATVFLMLTSKTKVTPLHGMFYCKYCAWQSEPGIPPCLVPGRRSGKYRVSIARDQHRGHHRGFSGASI